MNSATSPSINIKISNLRTLSFTILERAIFERSAWLKAALFLLSLVQSKTSVKYALNLSL